MKKVDIIQEGVKTAKIEYDVYCKLKGNKLEKLNISTICGDSKILLSIPMELSDDIDKLNTSSDYYNDICYVATSKSGTDISLKDRKKEYIEGNKVVCQEDCDFSEYDSTTQKAKCSCQVKESSSSFADMTINTTKLYENFADFKNIINFNILVCYKVLFTKLGLLKNIGSYIIAVIIIFHIICIIIFYMKQLRTIFKKIKDIIFGIKFFKLLKKANKKLKKKKKENINIIETRRNDGEDKNNEIVLIHDKKNKKRKKGRNIKKIEYDNDEFIKNNNTNNINTININNIHLDKKKKKKKIKIIKKRKEKKSRKQKKIEKVKKIMQYTDEEINMLPFEIAILYDKRNYCQYYISLLKTKHSFLFSFFNNIDYNSKIIKIDLFGIGFTLYYTVNALFYNDDTMHNIYENEGSFDIEYQIPKIIYSSLISMVLNTLLKILALSNEGIIYFKGNKTKTNVKKRAQVLRYNLRIKFLLYFIISFIFLLFFWYYIAMFGAIYKNTQIYLIKDTLISFGLSMIYPFGIYLVPGFFRIPALSNPKRKRILLYNFSKVIQWF